MPDAPPIGQRFSHIYLQRGEPTQDSARMRRRLAALVVTFPDLTDFHHVVPRKLGVDVPWRGTQPDWAGFFSDCALTDVLDFVTAAWRHFAEKSRTGGLKEHRPWDRWLGEVQEIFQEEKRALPRR